jgi:two-component system cell cycle response regulator
MLSPASAQAKRRVLVVDDSRFVRTTFATILRGSFDVREAAEGEAAWALIQSDPSIVMVFTDLDMPKLNGFGLISRMREAKEERIRDLPIVVISGVDEPGWKERAQASGANDFISKSADASEVLSRLDHVLRLVATQKELQGARAASEPSRDPLTGTLTGEYLLTETRKRFSFARRHAAELSVMALRIDSHRELVRSAGQDAADQLLARIAKLVNKQIRTEDSIARVADATFLVVAPGTSAEQVAKLAERLHAQLEQAKLTFAGKPVRIVARFGIAAIAQTSAERAEELMAAALKRLDGPQPTTATATAPASARLPAEVEQALQVLERLDAARLGHGAKDLLQRLARIAKLIQVKPR